MMTPPALWNGTDRRPVLLLRLGVEIGAADRYGCQLVRPRKLSGRCSHASSFPRNRR